MRASHVIAFTKRTLHQFRHDRRTLAFIIVVPLLMILIFGYTFSGEVRHVNVVVVCEDTGLNTTLFPYFPDKNFNLSRSILEQIDTEVLAITHCSELSTAERAVEEGNAWAAIYFNQNFTNEFAGGISGKNTSANIKLFLDGSNPTITAAIMKEIGEAAGRALESAKMKSQSPVSITQDYIYGSADTRFIDYFAPGVMSFAVMMVTTMLTIILFVNERRNGTLHRVLATPAHPVEVVLGYAIAFGIICICQSIVILAAGILIFGIKVVGNLFLAFLVFFLIGTGHQGLGILLSAGAKNELQAIQFIPFIIFPSVLLAGLFWPVESIPAILQPLAYFIPLRYGIDAERGIMVRGWGLEHVWMQICVLAIFAIATIAGSSMLLNKKE